MELIVEIGCEELPARFVDPALRQMKAFFVEACQNQRLDVGSIDTAGTPRRLTLLIEDLADKQSDLREERTGPPANIAFDDDGNPTPAAQGFARGQGVDVDDLYTVDTERGQYLAADVFEEGAAATAILPDILADMLADIDFPKSMRWGSLDLQFGRPIRWILALGDGEVIPFEFAGVQSDDKTRGHRFAAPDAFAVGSIDDYLKGLRKAQVIVDPDERRQAISDALKEAGADAGGQVVDDPELVDEVTHLIELPLATTLNFDDKYLDLPPEVLISSMRSHQRYFAIEKSDQSGLLSACAVIYNTPVEDPSVVNKGNLKVLRARLDDAFFFWKNDLDTPLEEFRQALSDVIWIAALGSTLARTVRMAKLSSSLADALGFDDTVATEARRAAELSKADLVSAMVGEFPDLQGVMGREYALRAGEDEAVAIAIEEHYLPAKSDGPLPQTPAGEVVALADKLDAIVGCFGINMIPSSTSDPYGLRRAALGVLRILRDRQVDLDVLIEAAAEAYVFDDGSTPFEHGTDQVARAVKEFFVTRLRYQLQDELPTDVVNAVLAVDVTELPSVYGRAHALAELSDDASDFRPLALGFKRVVNILEKQAESVDLDALSVDAARFDDPAEEQLFDAAQKAQSEISSALESRQWSQSCRALIQLKDPVDNFFDSVMVMADDEATRHNRLALLAELQTLFFEVADISKIKT